MILRNVLDNSLRGDAMLHFAPRQPNLSHLANLLLDRHGDGDRPSKSPEELAALVERLRDAHFDWGRVSAADRGDVAWVLWDGPEPAADQQAFLENFLHWVETPWRRIQARRIASSWALAFDPARPSTQLVGDWLSVHAARLLEPWSDLADEFAIFSVTQGPAQLARSFLQSDETAEEFFERLGLSERALSGGLMLAVLGAAAELVEPRLARQPSLAARLMDLSLYRGAFRPQASGPSARHAQEVAAKLVEALLLPWQREEPAPALKTQLLDYLLRHYDDPRIDDACWRRARPAAKDIMRAWLNREALAGFFRVAADTKTADPALLRLKQKFWLANFDRIDDAWLATAPSGSAAPFGAPRAAARLVGCKPGHCALLLRIRGVTIAETSYADHEHVWLHGNELTPARHRGTHQTYPETYPAVSLQTGGDFSSSYGSNQGAAPRQRLQSFIERHTGIALRAPA